ncbi:helix-turn-helix domain-containing protein [Pseudactinotalea terrae]|uniref:helix-turn-helix domain-containing protein n=1 Tax=Pseudactinotalea terrae TaxID=1743262 RepID=UPI001F4FBEB7|nr:helix-turn-helix domain-containing protein [Pseudactinotalea terrae]
MRIREGFPGQRLRVLPPDVVRAALAAGMTRRLLVTDAGHYPHALHHGATRPHGAHGTIIIVVSSGRGACRTGERVVEVGPGQALVVPARTPHRYWSDDNDPWTISWMHIQGADVVELERVVTPEGHAAVVDMHEPLHVVGELERALTAMEVDETTPQLLRAAGAAWSVLAQLVADQAAGSQNRTEPVRAAQNYLREHLDAPVRVGELAAQVGLSTSHFAALFRKATGGGVIEYVKRLRIARASELLVTTAMPVAEVARTVGYDDPFYFSRQFRGVHDCSPSEFRERANT